MVLGMRVHACVHIRTHTHTGTHTPSLKHPDGTPEVEAGGPDVQGQPWLHTEF